MKVEHFMTKDPVTSDVADSCMDVARRMEEKNVGAVVVLRNGKVDGIVTDRQLALHCLTTEAHQAEPIEYVMTPRPATVTAEDNLFHVLDVFRSAGVVHRLPVVDDGNELVGLVSLSDVAVIAKDLLDAILLDQTHHALAEARLLTGGKRIQKRIRNPTTVPRIPKARSTARRTRSRRAASSRARTMTARNR